MNQPLSSRLTTQTPVSARKAETHIGFLITQGFAARMMLRAGVPGKLIAEGARVTVLSPNASEEYFKNEFEVETLALRQTPAINNRIAGRFRAYRPYLLDRVDENPTLMSLHKHLFENRPVLGSALLGINRTLARSCLFRNASRVGERILNRSKGVKRLLQELKPDLLVLPNPFGVEETVYLLYARELSIPVACQMLSWDNITAKGTPLLMPDYFISWGPIMTEEIAHFYQFSRDKIFECGVPHFDVYSQKQELTSRKNLLRKLNLSPELPYIFYGMVAAMHCPREVEILTWLAEQVNNDAFAEPCSLVIRPHPETMSGVNSLHNEAWAKLRALLGPRVALDVPPVLSKRLAWDLPKNDMYHLASLLDGCAMCLNASSTLCLDACMLDRPVVNIGFDGWEKLPYERSARKSLDFIHMAKLLAFGGVRVARSFRELKESIDAYLNNPALDREGRRRSVEQECGPLDGRAAERVANVLTHLTRQQSDSVPE